MKKIFLILASLMVFTACSNVDYSRIKRYPKWVASPRYEDGIAGVGSAKISDLGFDFARKEAMANARADLARQIAIKVNATFKSYMAKSGVDERAAVDKVVEEIYRDIVSQEVTGSRVEETWESPQGELFVLMVVENSNIIKRAANFTNKPEVKEVVETFRGERSQEHLQQELANFFN